MELKFSNQKPEALKVDALVLNFFESKHNFSGTLSRIDKALDELLSAEIKESELKGKLFESFSLHTHGKISPKRIFLIGSGKENEYDTDKLSKVTATAFRQLNKKGLGTVAFFFTGNQKPLDKIATQVEAILTAGFDPAIYKSKDEEKKEIREVVLGDESFKNLQKANGAIQKGKAVGESINWSRRLVAEPANVLTPGKIVEEARKMAREYDLEIEVLDETQAREIGMGAFSAIAQGSDEPSYMLSLRYNPLKPTKEKLAILGKGVTFDSGGLSIKPSDKMNEMKMDMAGAAAVLATMKVIGQIKPQISVIGITPLTENLPSGKATKPGDVVKALNGKTIEIINTDAEGRVVLADALVWAEKLGATHIVDIATLTGAVIIALGDEVTALLSNKKAWSEKVLSAAKESGEKMWLLPTFDLYKDLLKSSIADYANVPSSRQAGVIAGAMFLSEFVKKGTPWAHLDIGGTAWLDNDKPYMAKGPSGVGVKTFINLIKSLEINN